MYFILLQGYKGMCLKSCAEVSTAYTQQEKDTK